MRVGVIGTGRIADRFVKTALVGCDQETTISYVYNPRIESARKFAKDHGIEGYTSELQVFHANVDIVYVATPHETHYEYCKSALLEKKHVLCEKPMALCQKEVVELFQLANANNVVLKEAIKTAYCPGFKALLSVISRGEIGEVRDVEAGFTRLGPTNNREFWSEQYGGSFLEFGSYVLLPVLKLLGTNYNDVEFKSLYGKTGVDIYTKTMLTFEESIATVKSGLGVKSEGQLLISGTNGYILAESPWWMTKKFEVRHENPNQKEVYTFPYESSGLQYEFQDFLSRVVAVSDTKSQEQRGNELDSCGVTEDESIALAGIFEKFVDKHMNYIPSIRENNCKKVESQQSQMKFWAHRGCSMTYPENTLESFEAAAKIPGITGIELDVQFTKDGEIVVFHDENVRRVTDGNRNVVEYTLDELKQLKIQIDDEHYTRIPTLREVLTLLKPYCESNGLLINIELKTGVIRYEGIEAATLKIVKELGLEQYIVYSSFLAESVGLIKKLDPTVKTGMLGSSLFECIRDARVTNADALHPWVGGMDSEIPEDMRHMPVRVWNMEEPFYQDGRILKEKHMEKYAILGATEVIINVPEEYLM